MRKALFIILLAIYRLERRARKYINAPVNKVKLLVFGVGVPVLVRAGYAFFCDSTEGVYVDTFFGAAACVVLGVVVFNVTWINRLLRANTKVGGYVPPYKRPEDVGFLTCVLLGLFGLFGYLTSGTLNSAEDVVAYRNGKVEWLPPGVYVGGNPGSLFTFTRQDSLRHGVLAPTPSAGDAAVLTVNYAFDEENLETLCGYFHHRNAMYAVVRTAVNATMSELERDGVTADTLLTRIRQPLQKHLTTQFERIGVAVTVESVTLTRSR